MSLSPSLADIISLIPASTKNAEKKGESEGEADNSRTRITDCHT